MHSDGSWYKARVIDVRGQTYEVHFYGYEDSDNEFVKLNQIRYSRGSDLATNRRDENEWETTRNPPGVSRVDQSRRTEGVWSESGGPQRIRRPFGEQRFFMGERAVTEYPAASQRPAPTEQPALME